MTEQANYSYNVMPFGVKNTGATYQMMMKKFFQEEIREALEVYMDNIIVKSSVDTLHTQHLHQVFERVRQYNMRLNPEKCTFAVRSRKFIGFYLMERGIEVNPEKCEVVIFIKAPTSKKDIQRLNGMLTTLNKF